jgi:hypothetical protein
MIKFLEEFGGEDSEVSSAIVDVVYRGLMYDCFLVVVVVVGQFVLLVDKQKVYR